MYKSASFNLLFVPCAFILAFAGASAKPDAAGAYLGPGLENYLLSLNPAPLRVPLRVTSSNVDRERGFNLYTHELDRIDKGGH